jgi:hypothetical protein
VAERSLPDLKSRLTIDTSGLKTAEEHARGFGSNLLGSLGLLSAGLAAVGLGIGAAFELKGAIDSTTALGNEVYKLTTQYGLSAENASKWVYIAHHAGVESDTMARGIKTLSKHLEDMALHLEFKGNPLLNAFAEELKNLGVKALDVHGKMRPVDDVLGDIADAFAKLPEHMNKAGIAANLFGKNGAELIPVLVLGRKGIAELAAEAQKYGLILSTENVAQIHSFILKQRELDSAMQGLRLTIGEAVIPMLSRLAEYTMGAINNFRLWLKDHPDVIASLQKLANSGITLVVNAVSALITLLTGGSGTGNTAGLGAFNEEGSLGPRHMDKAAKAHSGVATSINQIATSISTFLGSKSTQDFFNFWKNLKDWLDKVGAALDKVQGFLDANQKAQDWLRTHSPLSWIGQDLGALVTGGTAGGSFLGGTPVPGGVTPHHRQSGGPVVPGRVYTVGERGPETLVMGSRGVVIPNAGAPAASERGAGSTVHLVLHGAPAVNDPDGVRRMLQRMAFIGLAAS